MLGERPAVVPGRRRLLAETFRLVPRRRIDGPLREQSSDPSRSFVDRRVSVTGPLGRDVADRQHTGRRARLAESLVVFAEIVDEVAGRPDVDLPVGLAGCLVRIGERYDRRERGFPFLEAVVGHACGPNGVSGQLRFHHARQVLAVEECRHLRRHLPRLGVGGLAPADDEIDLALLLDRHRERS